MSDSGLITEKRRLLHRCLTAASGPLSLSREGVPSIADSGNKASIAISKKLCDFLDCDVLVRDTKMLPQTAGRTFEKLICDFLENTFPKLSNLRPGKWKFIHENTPGGISAFKQYSHLAEVASLLDKIPDLKTAFGSDYLISPDIVISRSPEEDTFINEQEIIVDSDSCDHSDIRSAINEIPILHASISLKWTIRSDRVQNARSEALSLIRNRKGRSPHVAVVTGEPTPARLASISLGTGDIDCVYHFALTELRRAIKDLGNEDTIELMNTMCDGGRLKDISDLPLDLAV